MLKTAQLVLDCFLTIFPDRSILQVLNSLLTYILPSDQNYHWCRPLFTGLICNVGELHSCQVVKSTSLNKLGPTLWPYAFGRPI